MVLAIAVRPRPVLLVLLLLLVSDLLPCSGTAAKRHAARAHGAGETAGAEPCRTAGPRFGPHRPHVPSVTRPAGAEKHFLGTLLPAACTWSEKEQGAADKEWQQLHDNVSSIVSSTLAHGGTSNVSVSFRGRVVARSTVGRGLCFLTLHALRRCAPAPSQASKWQLAENGETLKVLIKPCSWRGAGDFNLEIDLARVDSEIMLEGYCGRSKKVVFFVRIAVRSFIYLILSIHPSNHIYPL